MRSLGKATGCSARLRFVEEVKPTPLIKKAQGVIVCNSTIGMFALSQNKPVYCVGESIYAMPGMAVDKKQMPLSEFWTALPQPDEKLREDFFRVLRHDALVHGSYSRIVLLNGPAVRDPESAPPSGTRSRLPPCAGKHLPKVMILRRTGSRICIRNC